MCIHCQTRLSNNQGTGISHLRNHIQVSCKQTPPDIDRSSIFASNASTTDTSNFIVDPKITRDFMTKFWISANVAFKKIEDKFFRK